jgi:hypothetical protein
LTVRRDGWLAIPRCDGAHVSANFVTGIPPAGVDITRVSSSIGEPFAAVMVIFVMAPAAIVVITIPTIAGPPFAAALVFIVPLPAFAFFRLI